MDIDGVQVGGNAHFYQTTGCKPSCPWLKQMQGGEQECQVLSWMPCSETHDPASSSGITAIHSGRSVNAACILSPHPEKCSSGVEKILLILWKDHALFDTSKVQIYNHVSLIRLAKREVYQDEPTSGKQKTVILVNPIIGFCCPLHLQFSFCTGRLEYAADQRTVD